MATESDSFLAAVRTEFGRYRRLAEIAIEQVDDAALQTAIGKDGNSIAVLLRHLSGNLQSRFTDFLTTDGEKPWRDRDGEFVDPGAERAQLLADWTTAWQAVDDALAAVATAGPDVWSRDVVIRQQQLTVADALLRSVAHVANHVGQIVLLARHAAGSAWVSPSIPRGESKAYAENPTREKSPDDR